MIKKLIIGAILIIIGIIIGVSMTSAVSVEQLSSGSFQNITFTTYQNQSLTLNLPSNMRFVTSGTITLDEPGAFEELVQSYNYGAISRSVNGFDVEVGYSDLVWELGRDFVGTDHDIFNITMSTGTEATIATSIRNCQLASPQCLGLAVNASNIFIAYGGGGSSHFIQMIDRETGTPLSNHTLSSMSNDLLSITLCEDGQFVGVEQDTLEIHIFGSDFSNVDNWVAEDNSNGIQDLACYGGRIFAYEQAGVSEILEYSLNGTYWRNYNSSNSNIFDSSKIWLGMNDLQFVIGNGNGNDFEIFRGYGAFTNNPWLETGTADGTREWQSASHYRDNVSQINFTNTQLATINDWIAGNCGGSCNVPFLFHSDDSGLLRFNLVNFSNEGFIENSQTFTTPTSEDSVEEFEINISYDNTFYSNDPSAILIYNNTQYNATAEFSGTNAVFNVTLTTPFVSSTQNISLYWEINLSGSEQFIGNSTLQNQTINDISAISVAGTCPGGSFPAVTFSVQDETNRTAITTDVEYNFDYGITNTSAYNVAGTLSGVGVFHICVPDDFDDYVIGPDAMVFFGEGDYVEERFHLFENFALSNTTTTNHTLYNLMGVEASSFLFTTKELTLDPVVGAYLQLMRWFPEINEYKVVEMALTDENGETIMKVVEEDVDYRISVNYRNGTQIDLVDTTRFVCLVAPCDFDIFVSGDTASQVSHGVEINLTFNNNTNIFRLEYNDPQQLTDEMTLKVTQELPTGDITICETSSTSYVGVLTCDATGYDGLVRAQVIREASPPIIIGTLIVDIGVRISDLVGGEIVLLMVWILGSFLAVLGAFVNPILGMVLALLAYIPALALRSTTFAVIGGLAVLVIIGIHFILRSRQNEQ